jgi:GNAT superfamily N-acetyltransferase
VRRMDFSWRGHVATTELNALHAEAFETRVRGDDEWPWEAHLAEHSLGWVIAREGAHLSGFANVLWDGFTHAWIQDVMVAMSARRGGVGRQLIRQAKEHTRIAGCEWLHVDFEPDLASFYIGACGFTPTPAGLIRL